MSTSMAHPTRRRLVTAAGELFRRQGFAATGVKAILSASDTPYGSLYHHFPAGKSELGVAVIHEGAIAYRDLVAAYFGDDRDVVLQLRQFFEDAAEHVEQSGFADACPIATIAGEIANTDESMRSAAAEAFNSWIAAFAGRLTRASIAEHRAHVLAVQCFCLLEGAFLLARVQRDVGAIRAAGESMVALLSHEPLFGAA